MQLTYEMKNGSGIMHIGGSLLASDADAFRQSFNQWHAQAGCRDVIADLSSMDMLDSAGLGCLIAALKRVSEKGGDLCIAGLQKRPRLVFEVTRAHKVFEIFASVDEALRSKA